METTKRHTFVSEWGLHLVMLAIALPIVGLAYLAWTVLPAKSAPEAVQAPSEVLGWRARGVIAAFHSAGLTAEELRGETKEERDGFAMGMVVEARRFRISAKEGEMGMVLSFENVRDLEQVRDYYQGLNRALPQYGSWVYVKDNVLVQINHEVPESVAREYARVLEGIDE